MKLILYVMIALMQLLVSPAHAESGNAKYQLGSGDIISIQVYGEEELSFEEILLTDAGTVSFPFLDEVVAKGKTAKELENILTAGLRDGYLVNPRVTVSIIEYRDFFMNGEVEEPGGYPFKPGLTLRKAIAIAGGLTERASKNKMFIIRNNDPEKITQKVTMGSLIAPGDIITIEQGFF